MVAAAAAADASPASAAAAAGKHMASFGSPETTGATGAQRDAAAAGSGCELRSASATSQGPPIGMSATSQGPPIGMSLQLTLPTAEERESCSPPGTPPPEGPPGLSPTAAQSPRMRSCRFSDTNIVRTYSSQELIERDPSISDFTRLEIAQFEEQAALPLKEHDGPDAVSDLVDQLVRTLFNDKPRTPAELRAMIGPERCAEVCQLSREIAERFEDLLARLQALEPGRTYGLLPSNSKLQKEHVVWIQQLARWVASDITVAQKPRPAQKPAQQRRGMCGVCGGRVSEE